MSELLDKLVDIHTGLDAKRVPHAFGGAIALSFWTFDPRGTNDLDVNVFVPASDAGRVLDALPDGVARDSDSVERIVRDEQIRLWWGQTPVDLFFSYADAHRAAEANRRRVTIQGREIEVLAPVELAVFKAMFDRAKDWVDIQSMLMAYTLDIDAVREALIEMVGEDDERLEKLKRAARQADEELRRDQDSESLRSQLDE